MVRAVMGGFGLWRKAKDGLFEVCGVPLRRSVLCRLLRVAQRGGFLFRCLKACEVKFVRLVVALAERVRSFVLARAIAPIVKKLLEALKGSRELMISVLGEVAYWMKEGGRGLAEKISGIAVEWGNRSAVKWSRDLGFIRYLTVMNLAEFKRRRASFEGGAAGGA
jgi:hypothetical protein